MDVCEISYKIIIILIGAPNLGCIKGNLNDEIYLDASCVNKNKPVLGARSYLIFGLWKKKKICSLLLLKTIAFRHFSSAPP